MLGISRTKSHALAITNTTLLHATHDLVLEINVLLWSLAAGGILILVDKDVMVLTEETIDILKSTTGSFRVKEIYNRDERGVEDSPDDIELPAKGANSNWGDFHNLKIVSTEIKIDISLNLEDLP